MALRTTLSNRLLYIATIPEFSSPITTVLHSPAPPSSTAVQNDADFRGDSFRRRSMGNHSSAIALSSFPTPGVGEKLNLSCRRLPRLDELRLAAAEVERCRIDAADAENGQIGERLRNIIPAKNIPYGSEQELFWRCGRVKRQSLRFNSERRRLEQKRGLIHCCSYSTSTSADQQKGLAAAKPDSNGVYENRKLQCGYLVTKDANWQVRRMVETGEEMKEVASVQAEAFHEPVFIFNDMFFYFFKAEVLSGLLYKLRNSPPDRYACLVAEPRDDDQESRKELAGVVDVTVDREGSVLQHLPGAKEYLYVSGIAVLNKFRRKKVATTLLKACDALSAIWGFDYLVLRAYEDDYGARKLYTNAGYRVVSGDPAWTTSWIGRRRRILMVKQTNIQ